MRRIRVEEAKVGDVLAAPVTDRQGRTLLPRGPSSRRRCSHGCRVGGSLS